jgi:hypothetical protein
LWWARGTSSTPSPTFPARLGFTAGFFFLVGVSFFTGFLAALEKLVEQREEIRHSV